ncbi:hypothetical protein H6F67_17310 [Microcoleus sp. FACHB-1515]|nr:hypothetical protein [Microcoleus sp. FACHB-1515]MBD2091604.1 hypothetical protein [Microcoleus sp. FACHB-1515]
MLDRLRVEHPATYIPLNALLLCKERFLRIEEGDRPQAETAGSIGFLGF